MSNENPDLRIPVDEKDVHEIAKEEEEDSMAKRQRRNLAEAQAHFRGF